MDEKLPPADKSPSQPPPYHAPRLTVYGTMRSLTKATNSGGSVTDSSPYVT
jgi:hypothetical protein